MSFVRGTILEVVPSVSVSIRAVALRVALELLTGGTRLRAGDTVSRLEPQTSCGLSCTMKKWWNG